MEAIERNGDCLVDIRTRMRTFSTPTNSGSAGAARHAKTVFTTSDDPTDDTPSESKAASHRSVKFHQAAERAQREMAALLLPNSH